MKFFIKRQFFLVTFIYKTPDVPIFVFERLGYRFSQKKQSYAEI